MSQFNDRQRALLDLLKVTHHHALDDKVALEVAQRYLAAIDGLAETPKRETAPKQK